MSIIFFTWISFITLISICGAAAKSASSRTKQVVIWWGSGCWLTLAGAAALLPWGYEAVRWRHVENSKKPFWTLILSVVVFRTIIDCVDRESCSGLIECERDLSVSRRIQYKQVVKAGCKCKCLVFGKIPHVSALRMRTPCHCGRTSQHATHNLGLG